MRTLSGGPRGDGCSPAARAGIDAFVDLTQAQLPGPSETQLTDYDGVAGDAAGGVRVRSTTWHPHPTRLVTTLDEIDRLLEDGRTVYVHCWGGVGRTGLVVGAWLIRHGAATGDTVMDVLGRLRTADAVDRGGAGDAGAGRLPPRVPRVTG